MYHKSLRGRNPTGHRRDFVEFDLSVDLDLTSKEVKDGSDWVAAALHQNRVTVAALNGVVQIFFPRSSSTSDDS